jgi:hypothetical protein
MNEKPIMKCRSRFGWLGWGLCVAIFGGLYFVQNEGVKRNAQIQQNQQSILSCLQRIDLTMGTLDSNKVVAALTQQEKNLSTLQTRVETHAAGFAATLKLQKDVNVRILAVLAPESGETEVAVKLAEEAKVAGNLELAMVYLTNAIRSEPRNLRLLEKYTGWVVEGKSSTILQGAENLLQGSLYGVNPRDVPAVAKLLGDVASARATNDKVVARPEVAITSLADSFAKLEKTPLRWDDAVGGRAGAQIEELSALLDQLDDSASDEPLLRKRMIQRLKEVQAFVLGHQILDLAAMRFENLATTGKLVDTHASPENRTAALSALQATESVVNQIWSVPISLVTPGLRDALVALPEKLRKEAVYIQDSVERLDIEIAEESWKHRPNQTDKQIQSRIVGCQAQIQQCSKILSKVQGPKAKDNSALLFEKMSLLMKDLRGKQFAQYQEWATKVIEDTRKKYESDSIHTDKGARDAFNINGKAFITIDQSLLSPEVAQFWQAVFSKLLGELGGEDQSKLQKESSFSGTSDENEHCNLLAELFDDFCRIRRGSAQ